MFFSEAVKMIRRKRLLSQEAFAKELGVSFTTVNRWETKKTTPTYKTLKSLDKYCKENGIDIDLSDLTMEAEENG